MGSSLFAFAGFLAFWLFFRIKQGGFEKLSRTIIQKAENAAEELTRRTTLALKEKEQAIEHRLAQQTAQLEKKEQRTQERNDRLDKRADALEQKFSELQAREARIAKREKELLDTSKSAAKERLREELKEEVERETLDLLMKKRKEHEAQAEHEAAKVITTAINRLALPTVSEAVTTSVALPNDEMKRRIIGREGKNIRALEKLTGVNFLLDDTPHAIVISSFDPLRKEVAKRTLEMLIRDGRIHPSRIEEVVEKMEHESAQRVRERGEKGALEANVLGLHPELIHLLGQLSLRFSYGQNVLDHSVEVSRIMRIMAEELHLDAALAKRIGLLHDIGKAAPPEKEGAHALLGGELALKYGESKKVANGIATHHNEVPPLTPEASLCSAADALSGGRPGARVENIASYIQRLKKLEQLSYEFGGIEKAYALSSGRELRIIVKPEEVDDAGAVLLARNLAKKIETNVSYPGKIKITVIREQTNVEYAL